MAPGMAESVVHMADPDTPARAAPYRVTSPPERKQSDSSGPLRTHGRWVCVTDDRWTGPWGLLARPPAPAQPAQPAQEGGRGRQAKQPFSC